MEQEIDRFPGKTDNGKKYIIVKYQEYMSTGGYDNPQSETATTTRFLTSDGEIVNQIDSETFQIFNTDIIIRKV